MVINKFLWNNVPVNSYRLGWKGGTVDFWGDHLVLKRVEGGISHGINVGGVVSPLVGVIDQVDLYDGFLTVLFFILLQHVLWKYSLA